MRHRIVLSVAAFVLLNAPLSPAQSPAARPEFEVASVKTSAAGARGSVLRTPAGRVDAKNVSLKLLISSAYGVEGFEISGGPSWINSGRFDVEAKAGSAETRQQMMPMLQSLLEDRFKLKTHRETKEGPIFLMTVAKGGLKLQPLKEGTCGPLDAGNPPPAPGQKPPCGVLRPGVGGPNMILEGVGVSAATLARTLTLMLGRPVKDNTRIAGPFDALRLEYAPPYMTADPAPSSDGIGPSIVTALQEQLGLKLESAKGQVEVLVIDRLERTTDN